MEKSTIAVFSATGQQGGAFIKAVLSEDNNQHFHIRAITRDPTSDRAKSLPPGISIVQGDLNNAESLKPSLEGCQYAFLVTDYWQLHSAEKEKQQVRNFIDVAKTIKTWKNIVWSTLIDTRTIVKPGELPTTEGNMYLPHYDGKGETDQWFLDAGLPTSFLLTTAYFENFYGLMKPTKDESDGKFQYAVPVIDNKDAVIPMIAVEDIGKAAYRMIKGGDKYIGKKLGIYTLATTYPDVISKIAKVTGANVKYVPIPKDVFLQVGGPQFVVNIYEFIQKYQKEYLSYHNDDAANELIHDKISFDTWLEQNKEKFNPFK